MTFFTRQRTHGPWLFAACAALYLGLIGPWLISAPSTFAVGCGVVLMVGLIAWAWRLFGRNDPTTSHTKEN